MLDEDSAGLRPHGGASRWWLAQSLRALDADLRKRGQRLVLRRGKAAEVIPALARETSAPRRSTWNRRYDQAGIAADDAVIAALKSLGLGGGTFPGNLLVEPGKLLNKDGGPLRVFTPFWKRVLSLGEPRKPLPAPKRLPPPPEVASDNLDDWQLEPARPDWAGGLRETWTPGEAAARERLADFLDDIRGYADDRNRPDRPVTSRLSPHLRFGEISAAEIFHAARFAADKHRARRRATSRNS